MDLRLRVESETEIMAVCSTSGSGLPEQSPQMFISWLVVIYSRLKPQYLEIVDRNFVFLINISVEFVFCECCSRMARSITLSILRR